MKPRFTARFLLIALLFIAGLAANSTIRSFSLQPSDGLHMQPGEQEQEIARLTNKVAELQIANAKLENELNQQE